MTNPTENGFEAECMDIDMAPPSEADETEMDHNFWDGGGDRVDSRMETPADTAFARTKRQEQIVLSLIQQAKALGSPTVDLSGKHLMAIPDELLQMEDLEYLYLSSNQISFLPDEFFKCFPKLKWLDLRNNHLCRIPSIYLGSHPCLRNLLLQNNLLKSLPLELGLVKTLHGLNITNNPLEFPPQDVISRGTYEIQKFLREMLQAKSSAKLNKDDLVLDCIFEDSCDSSSSDDWNTNASMMELARQRQRTKKSLSADTVSNGTGTTGDKSKLIGPVPLRRKLSSVQSWKVNPYPEPPPQEYIAFKMQEEKQLAKVREMNEKTDAILQRRKDEAILKGWRDNTKKMQAKKYRQTLTKGTKEYPETAEEAPFGVDNTYMKMLNNDERFKESREKPRRALSPATRARIEEEKASKIRELEKRIKDHTAQMVDRRKKPKGTPQEEMEAARRELDIVKTLQKDLMRRYQELKTWTTVCDHEPTCPIQGDLMGIASVLVATASEATVLRAKAIKYMYLVEINGGLQHCLAGVFQAEDLHRQLMNRRKNVEYRLKEFEADVRKNFPVGTRLRH
ncbi:hypothetical protein BaRGS_00037660 [Batillaria attramentaria]|uniref:Leucine-rich repeat-containing protein 27 n=1 Tax=Batillaria attramentaria TaxID=370345 RepID=A0ABD0J850_9CAEN